MVKDDELADVPKGTLPVTQEMLKNKILNDPFQAWKMLKTNPVAVVALSKVRREFETSENLVNNENFLEFMKIYNLNKNKLFNVSHIVDDLGVALTVELINEIWRSDQQDYKMKTINRYLLKNLIQIGEDIESFENTSSNRVIREIVSYAYNRIYSFEEYERERAKDHWSVLSSVFKDLLKNEFRQPPNEAIVRRWKAWFSFASSTIISAEVYRNNIAEMIMNNAIEVFDDLPEETKYQVAPWIKSFERILSDEEIDNEETK